MEHHSALKKKLLPFKTVWMNLEDVMLSKISQTKKKSYMISLIHGT